MNLARCGRGDGVFMRAFRDGVDPTQDAPPPPPRRKPGRGRRDPTAARAERAVHHLKKVGKKKGVSSE